MTSTSCLLIVTAGDTPANSSRIESDWASFIAANSFDDDERDRIAAELAGPNGRARIGGGAAPIIDIFVLK